MRRTERNFAPSVLFPKTDRSHRPGDCKCNRRRCGYIGHVARTEKELTPRAWSRRWS